jgi:hypothetical protein
MKGLLMGLGVLGGIALGLFPKLQFPKPTWWKVGMILFLFIDLILIFLPNTVANVPYADYMAQRQVEDNFNLKISKSIITKIENDKIYIANLDYPITSNQSDIAKIQNNQESTILNISYNPENKSFRLNNTVTNIIPLEYPYIVELKERVRIILLHVPLAWNSVIAYLLSMVFAIFYLRKKDPFYDTMSVS